MSSFESIYNTLLQRGQHAPTGLPPLTPQRVYDGGLKAAIQKLDDRREAGDVLKAALHLLNDDIESAHELAQAHEESETANLIHATLHRREQDYWNSKWWLSRIRHPLLVSVHGGVQQAKQFVDEVERSEKAAGASRSMRAQANQTSPNSKLAGYEQKELALQWRELTGLVDAARKEEGRT